jgi:signal transduction histidine kinase
MSIAFRNHSSLVGGFAVILAVLPIFFRETIDFYYVPIFKITVLILTNIFAFFLFYKKQREDFKYIIPFFLSIFFFFVSEILFFIYSFFETEVLFIVSNVVTLLAYAPIYIMLVTHIRRNEKYISRNIKILSLFITVFAIIVISPFATNFSRSLIENKEYVRFVIILVFLILDLDILAISVIFTYLNLRVKKIPHYWFTIVGAWFFILIGDVIKMSYTYLGRASIGATYDIIYNVSYSIFLVGFVIMFEHYQRPLTISEIERERLHYQSLSEEISNLASDLVTVTSLLRHDLYNDFVVIQNSLDLYKETKKNDFLEKLTQRINLVIYRFEGIKTETDILDTLKTQAIDLKIINEVANTFENVKVVSPVMGIKVKASNLLYSIFINLIQNAFQHAGENVKVEVEAVEKEEDVFIRIKDNGVGITNEQKKKIFLKGYRRSDIPGKGMGLYLVKIVIDRYGGSIYVEDNEPKGTIFVVKLHKFIE